MKNLFSIKLSLLAAALLALSTPMQFAHADTADINFDFPVPSPKDLTIQAGDSVRWLGASTFHPLRQVTSATGDTPTSGGFSSTSSTFTQQFDTPGTYYYQCTSHGTGGGSMRGSITVLAGSGDSPTPTPTVGGGDGECQVKPGQVVLSSPAAGAALTGARVALDWADTDCALRYKVEVRSKKKSGKVVDQKTVTKSAYKTVKLAKKSAYFWIVKACNNAGCGKAASAKFSIK